MAQSKSCWTVRNPAAPVSHKENLPRIYLKWSGPRITGNIRKHTRTHNSSWAWPRGLEWSIWSNACRLQTAAWRNVGQKSQAAQNQLFEPFYLSQVALAKLNIITLTIISYKHYQSNPAPTICYTSTAKVFAVRLPLSSIVAQTCARWSVPCWPRCQMVPSCGKGKVKRNPEENVSFC